MDSFKKDDQNNILFNSNEIDPNEDLMHEIESLLS